MFDPRHVSLVGTAWMVGAIASTTGNRIEAMTLEERIVLLHDGVIEQEGSPSELFKQPTNAFVGSFLGSPSMNFIKVRSEENGRRIMLPDGQTINAGGGNGTGLPDGDYFWGVRPEHFYPAGPNEDSILVAIDVVQPTGSRTYSSFALADAHVVAELEAHALDPTVRQKIPLGVALDRTAFFDLETGDALARPRPDRPATAEESK